MAANAVFLAQLRARVLEEIRLLDLQIEKSRAVRGLATTAPVHAAADSLAAVPVEVAATSSPIAAARGASESASSPPADSVSSPQIQKQPQQQQPLAEDAPVKRGSLLSFGKKKFLQKFEPRYIAVDAQGIGWWDSEASFAKQPTKPQDSIGFASQTTNSRGSTFKKCAKCWPLVTIEDCKEAKDPSLVYFGVSFINAKGDNELLVLAVPSQRERDEWVLFITKFIALYLAPRAESAEFVNMPVGAKSPLHMDCVLDGEAPGGNF